MSKEHWEMRLGDGRWVGSAQSAGVPNTCALARQQAAAADTPANAQPAAAAHTPGLGATTTTTYWPMTQHECPPPMTQQAAAADPPPMTQHEYEFVEERKRRMQEETQRRQSQQSLRGLMQVFQYKLELHKVQQMRLPNPLPDTWQMVVPGSASTLPVPRREPDSPLGSRFRTL